MTLSTRYRLSTLFRAVGWQLLLGLIAVVTCTAMDIYCAQRPGQTGFYFPVGLFLSFLISLAVVLLVALLMLVVVLCLPKEPDEAVVRTHRRTRRIYRILFAIEALVVLVVLAFGSYVVYEDVNQPKTEIQHDGNQVPHEHAPRG